MKLLLDEHYSPRIAQQLRERGYDVIAVSEESDLRGSVDEDILAFAIRSNRVLLTENVADFIALAQSEPEAKILFTANRNYPRGAKATTGRLVQALTELLEQDDVITHIRWL